MILTAPTALPLVFAQSAEDYNYTSPTPINMPGETSYSTYNNDWYENYGRHLESPTTQSLPSTQPPPTTAGGGQSPPPSGAVAGAVGSAQAGAAGGLVNSIPTGCGPEGNGYYRLCVPIPGFPQRLNNSLVEYVREIYKFALTIGGLIVFIMIVWGGIEYTVYAGNASKVDEAKDRIFNAVIGLLLLALSYIILNTINPELVNLKEPGGRSAIPAALPSLEEQAAENRYLHSREGAIGSALQNPDIYEEGWAAQEQFLQGQINKESAKSEPDLHKVQHWQDSLNELNAIRNETRARRNR